MELDTLGADGPHPALGYPCSGGQLPVSCPLEVPSPELCPSHLCRNAVWGVSGPMYPWVWKDYQQRKRTQQDRRTEMEFIGMVSAPLPGPVQPLPAHTPVHSGLGWA